MQRKIDALELKGFTQKIEEPFVYVFNCFEHIPVNSCIKSFGYNIKQPTRMVLGGIKKRIIQTKPTDKEKMFYEALVFIYENFAIEYSCETITISRLKNLYKKHNPHILKMAKRIIKSIPQVNMLNPRGCYEAIKALRDSYAKELDVDYFSSLFELKNPWTNKAE